MIGTKDDHLCSFNLPFSKHFIDTQFVSFIMFVQCKSELPKICHTKFISGNSRSSNSTFKISKIISFMLQSLLFMTMYI